MVCPQNTNVLAQTTNRKLNKWRITKLALGAEDLHAVALKIVFLLISQSWNTSSLRITENGKGDCKLLLIGAGLWRGFSLVSSSGSISCSLSLTSTELKLGELQSLVLEQGAHLEHIWSQELGRMFVFFIYVGNIAIKSNLLCLAMHTLECSFCSLAWLEQWSEYNL